MNELTRQCLALSMEDKEQLIKVLNASIIDEIEDDGRFHVLLKIATEIVGDGILTRSRDYNCVMGRKMIAWQMREEGYSLQAIGRRMGRHHATILHLLRLMEDMFKFPGCFKTDEAYWKQFTKRIKEYDIQRRATQGS